jgi:glutathione S-transferase
VAPFGQAPFLECVEEGWVMAQGHAIVRHLARRFDFEGKNDQEVLVSDMLMERLSDMRGHLMRIYFEYPEDQRQAHWYKWYNESFGVFQADLERFIGKVFKIVFSFACFFNMCFFFSIGI